MKKRNYYFDILRIIAMFMIIAHHITLNAFGLQPHLFGEATLLNSRGALILIILNTFVLIGVNLFFLISGYFRIKFSFKKVISLILQVYIVYGLVTALGIFLHEVPLNKETIDGLLFPFDVYWFLAAYVGIMLISPFLNQIIDYINKDHKKLIIVSMLLFTVYAFRHDTGLFIYGGYSLIWASILYVIGGLINKFDIKSKWGILLYLFSASFLSFVICMCYKSGDLSGSWNYFKYNNIFIFLESFGIFIWVNSWKFKIKSKKTQNIISFLGKNTLMVYMLHSSCWLRFLLRIPVRKMLEMEYFKITIMLLPIYISLIYVVCTFFSFLYNISFQKLINKVLEEKKKKK